MYDCGFTKENNWFRYRAAAIIIEDGCVLFAGNEREDYLYSIGGGVHMGETAEEFFKKILAVASGEQTQSEKHGYREIAIFKDGVTL